MPFFLVIVIVIVNYPTLQPTSHWVFEVTYSPARDAAAFGSETDCIPTVHTWMSWSRGVARAVTSVAKATPNPYKKKKI